jgi:uncharacterized protein
MTSGRERDPEGRPRNARPRDRLGRPLSRGDEGFERELWRALAQLAVAITHGLRGNDAGATTLRERAAEHLEPYAGTRPHGIDVDALLAWARHPTGPPPRLGGSERSGGGGTLGGALGE